MKRGRDFEAQGYAPFCRDGIKAFLPVKFHILSSVDYIKARCPQANSQAKDKRGCGNLTADALFLKLQFDYK